MEPKSSEHIPTPIEYTPQSPQNSGERSQDLPMPPQQERQEVAVERAGEQVRQVTKTTDSSSQTTVVQLPTPVPVATADDTTVADDNPAVAADDQVIEKEWVDKAKRIIAETREDPHRRERAVNKLQVDYLKKRYGKELGSDAA